MFLQYGRFDIDWYTAAKPLLYLSGLMTCGNNSIFQSWLYEGVMFEPEGLKCTHRAIR